MEQARLDRFIPDPDVQERFETTVRAPAGVVMEVATRFDMQSPLLVRAIFRLRETLLRASPHSPRVPRGLLDETTRLGWGLLAEEPGRWVACGARCQPWLADVKFVAIPAADFARYVEPGVVKIAWSRRIPARSRPMPWPARSSCATGAGLASGSSPFAC
jgi:hypothetical protein